MKIKLVQPGYETLTGYFGVIEFVDGRSVNDVTKREAEYLASLVNIETEEGVNPSVAQQILDTYGDTMPVETPVAPTAPQAVPLAKTYTADELAAVADAGGIKGVRAIADTLGLKGQSIAELIGRILAVASATPVSAVTETVAIDAADAQSIVNNASDAAVAATDAEADQFALAEASAAADTAK